MCSSECERVSNLTQGLLEEKSTTTRNTSSTMPQHRHSMNSTSTSTSSSTRTLFSLYVCLLCIVLCLNISSVDSAAIVKRRAISAENTSQSSESSDGKSTVCHSNTPCGWAVYIPVSRRVDYYMKNVCVCPEGKECLKSEDDVSVNAYVYRCKKKSPTKDD
uniref:Uncharacterized protein n=1 Tax=Cacopsylla melanoneura TaxID=428564 RepID=A0A8D8SX78_9HEMI